MHVMQGSYHIQHLDLSHNEFGEKAGEILGPALGTLLVCVTTVTMPVHLHGTNFAPFLLLTRTCYGAETSAILLLLKRALA